MMTYIQSYSQNITELYTNDGYVEALGPSREYDGHSIGHHAYGEMALRTNKPKKTMHYPVNQAPRDSGLRPL